MIEKLKSFLGQEPLLPFRIILWSGSQYDVTSPYQLAIGQTQLDYFFPRSDRTATLRMNQLAAVETLEVKGLS